ncbi:GNAT family N-acetyltransferase [Antribacter gilvus]|uniref:GNAT family N-acetyltransferase n=1 Tax=Antribacter gilvus TaxID=2304675 RepID=UPI000F77F75F|nr:GNAT family N-acetyltransferase [Antribacter gilvus]
MTTLPDPQYEFSADPGRVDAERVHELLVEHSYWARDRTREVTDAAIAGSRPFGVYVRETGEQAAFARVITDGATFAWLSDVIVDPAHRGRGLGKLLVGEVLAVLEPLGLRRTVLTTADADGLYERFGFRPVDPDMHWMERKATLPS